MLIETMSLGNFKKIKTPYRTCPSIRNIEKMSTLPTAICKNYLSQQDRTAANGTDCPPADLKVTQRKMWTIENYILAYGL